MIHIQEADFSLQAEVDRLVRADTGVGGVVAFVGTVRELTGDRRVSAIHLEYYPGMTEAELEKIEAAARARFEVAEILVIHRVGRLAVSDNIVLVVATAPHRAAAFEACRYVIDHLKVFATFWKKEITSDGRTEWIDSCPGCEAAASRWEELAGVAHTHPHDRAMAVTAPKRHHHGHGPGQGHGPVTWAGLRVGILTLSDSRTLAEDGSGDALEGAVLALGGKVTRRAVLPDERPAIQAMLVQWADQDGIGAILTTGGTGPGPRDVTPEATRAVCDRELPGIAELIRTAGLQQVRSAVLTRGIAAFRGATLVINLPGSTRGAVHSLEAVADLVPHILAMAHGGGHP
ncbi:MAG: molybdenum cofactor biosynthesis protein MoaE [Magnetococcales bacterium]|nr:molybdenum cofactor biosynthesis protein MoaE [Magnetococcales bacterium]